MKFNTLSKILLVVSALSIGACNKAPSKDSESSVVDGSEPIANDSELPALTTYLDVPSIQIHYQRYSGSYKDWGLWIWGEGKDGAEYKFNYSDDYGVIAYYPLSTFNESKNLGFIVKELFEIAGDGVWNKDYPQDRFMDLDMLTIDTNQSYHIYLRNGVGGTYTDAQRTHQMNAVTSCQFESSKKIVVNTNNPMTQVVIKRNGVNVEKEGVFSSQNKTYTLTLDDDALISDTYTAQVVFDGVSCTKAVSIRKLYDASFDEKYNYDGDDLGANYTKEGTTFKVWSPISTSIKLRIYENGTPTSVSQTLGNDTYAEYEMTKGEKGVFSHSLTGDLEGKYYTYFVKNSSYPEGREIVDPYAKSCGVNGLRGMIVDFEKTNPTNWNQVNYLNYDRKELTVYETHIAELTCSDTWGGTAKNAKLYDGFYETGTTYTKDNKTVKTGFDHIKELGVNAVQIIPIFDQANDETNMSFNWGYNPLNYNCLEGGYSSNPYDGYQRIKEFKKLIQAYNEANITIIMDVVYNHVNGLNGCNFDVLMPFYYFRYTSLGSPSNGSGCGNETASDKYMYSKFMIDSIAFWTKEYKLGGFRFDLMGIHDVGTMDALTAKAKTINPNIVIYGEPWAGGTTALPAGMKAGVQANAQLFQGYGQFNDQMRDAMVASGMSAAYDRGWVTQTKWAVGPNDPFIKGIQGITFGPNVGPDKTVSYATCHDNYTLHDRAIVADTANYDLKPKDYQSEETIEKMNALSNSVVFTSQGTTFMLAGEEMLRTKIVYDVDGNPIMAKDKEGNSLGVYEVSGNSYSSSYKTNEINYEWKINHQRLFETYQKLISLRKTASGLKAVEPNEVEVLNNKCVIKVTFKDGNRTYVAYHTNGATDEKYEVDTTGYSMYLDTLGNEFNSSKMTLKKFETLIIYK